MTIGGRFDDPLAASVGPGSWAADVLRAAVDANGQSVNYLTGGGAKPFAVLEFDDPPKIRGSGTARRIFGIHTVLFSQTDRRG